MPRPVKYDKEAIAEMLELKAKDGTPLKEQCKSKGWAYISVNRATKRYGLKNPLKFAKRVGRRAMGDLVYEPVALSKNQEKDTAVTV